MTDLTEAYTAGVDAVIADNGLNRGGFRDAIRTVLNARLSNSEVTAWIDALATAYESIGIINNATYNNLRGEIISEGRDVAIRQFEALGALVGSLPESQPLIESALFINLREDRDQINNAIDRCDALIDAEPAGTVGRLVKDVLRDGKRSLREYRQRVRDQIQNITGNPDSTQ
jgi:hypothetical protein